MLVAGRVSEILVADCILRVEMCWNVYRKHFFVLMMMMMMMMMMMLLLLMLLMLLTLLTNMTKKTEEEGKNSNIKNTTFCIINTVSSFQNALAWRCVKMRLQEYTNKKQPKQTYGIIALRVRVSAPRTKENK